MVTATKRKLSGSTDGKPILVAATETPGTAIHTAVSGTTPGTFDEIWLWVHNTSASAVQLTIEFGGATAPDQNIVMSVTARQGLYLAIPGLILQNEATVKAFASTTNVITVTGFVNTMTD